MQKGPIRIGIFVWEKGWYFTVYACCFLILRDNMGSEISVSRIQQMTEWL